MFEKARGTIIRISTLKHKTNYNFCGLCSFNFLHIETVFQYRSLNTIVTTLFLLKKKVFSHWKSSVIIFISCIVFKPIDYCYLIIVLVTKLYNTIIINNASINIFVNIFAFLFSQYKNYRNAFCYWWLWWDKLPWRIGAYKPSLEELRRNKR